MPLHFTQSKDRFRDLRIEAYKTALLEQTATTKSKTVTRKDLSSEVNINGKKS